MLANISFKLNRLKSINVTTANIGWLFFDRIFRVITAMLVGVWIARYLGPEQYGLWSYVFLFPTTLAAVATLGFTNILVTLLIQQREKEPFVLLGTAFILRLIVGSICYGLITLVSYIIHRNEQAVQILILFTSVSLIFQVFDVIELFFQSKTQSKRSVWAKTIGFAVGVGLKIFLLLGNYPLRAFITTIVVENGLSAILLVYFYHQYTKTTVLKWQFSRSMAKELLGVSWPIMLGECMIYIYMRVDQFMIHNLTSNTELGLYTAALRISESWYFIAGAITSSFYPSIVALWVTDRETFYKRYQQLLNRLTTIAFVMALGISIMAPHVEKLLFGERFEGVASVLAVHVWAGVAVFLGVGSTNLFIINNLQKSTLLRTSIGVFINVLLNLYLIPRYGAIGASVATLIAQIVASYLVNALTQSTRFIFQMQTKALLNVIRLRFNTLF